MSENKVGLGKLYKIQEVADYLGISRQRLYVYMSEGIIVPSVKGKQFTRFIKADILNGLASMRASSNVIKRLTQVLEHDKPIKLCSEKGCDNQQFAKGLCRKHWRMKK